MLFRSNDTATTEIYTQRDTLSLHDALPIFGWFPSLLVDTAGVDPVQAGALLALFAIWGFPVGLLIPVLAARRGWALVLPFLGLAGYAGGFLGLLLTPAAAPVLWISLLGIGSLILPLTLALINLRSRTHAGSVALSGFSQGVGYALGAVGTFAFGLVHDLAGGWTAPLLFLLALTIPGIPAAIVVGRRRFVEDELLRRPR